MNKTNDNDDEKIERRDDDPALIVDVGGFEGPLDLLLELARRQKVDLHRISILALAEQYLAFVDAARQLRLELAADYLVMAAWLAYLKSRLLLPREEKAETGPSADELAGVLADRLRRLEAIRLAGKHLMERPQLGRDVFQRGAPEEIARIEKPLWEASLHDLLTAYARQRQKHALARVTIEKRLVWSLAEARAALERLIGEVGDWAPLDQHLLAYAVEPGMRRSVAASSFASMLEMVREGALEVRQAGAYDTLYVRRPAKDAAGDAKGE
jgi:segregation and condensation protein A